MKCANLYYPPRPAGKPHRENEGASSVRSIIRVLLVVLVLGAGAAGPAAYAGNTHTGDNKTDTDQSGENGSGTANAGQITGVTADGQTSVDATNSTSNADVTSGDARGSNTADTFTGLDISTTTAVNTQEGDNKTDISQDGEATSGNASDGQIIAAVTASGGSAVIVASNISENNDVRSGRAKDENTISSFTGLRALLADNSSATNVQAGDNKLKVDQTNPTSTGNAVTGQVIGVTSAGVTSLDATNRSEDNDVDTVNAFGANSVDAFIGLQANATNTAVATNTQDGDNSGSISQDAPGTSNTVTAFVGQNADATAATSTNVQEGDNKLRASQDSPISATSYDSLAGQVVGDVTSAGGSADLVLANTSTDNDVSVVGVAGQVAGVTSAGATSVDATNLSDNNDVEGGVTYATTVLDAFVGLDAVSGLGLPLASNLQQGDNKFASAQSSSAVSGEPVAGQILGVVTGAGGSSDVVLANTTVDSDLRSQTARDTETDAAFIGLLAATDTTISV